MFQYVFVDWELPGTPSFVSCGAWLKTHQQSTTQQRGIPAFQEVHFGSRSTQPNLHSIRFLFFYALVFLVMLRNVTILHCSALTSREGKYFNSAMRQLKALQEGSPKPLFRLFVFPILGQDM